ncbi:MAG: dihydrofolate reductase family protein [Thermodesulfobacteriota bacterium]
MLRTLLVAAMTLDGSIGPMPLGSAQDRRLLLRLRAESDASIIGAGTVRNDDPELALDGGELPGTRLRAVVSMSGNLDPEKKLFRRGPKPVIITELARRDELGRRYADLAEVIGVPAINGQLPVPGMLHHLRRLGVRRLLLEGGGGLNGAFLAADAVDEVYVTVVPVIAVDPSLPRLVRSPHSPAAPLLPLQLRSCRVEEESGELFLHYIRRER